MTIDRKIDVTQIQASSDAVVALIEQELARGIPSEKILLAGFSQGGAVVYHCGLSYDKPLAGILALSTYLATRDTLACHPANHSIPIHIFHGTVDDVVPESLGQRALQNLQAMGYQPRYKSYPMGHEVCMPQVRDLSASIAELLA